MKSKNLIITDKISEDYNNIKNLFIILWCRKEILNKKKIINIFDKIEENSLNIKNKFLDFVRDLSNKKVIVKNQKKNLFDALKVNNFNSWWYSEISEKCNWAKSYYINEVIKCIALDIFIKKQKIKNIYIDIQQPETIEVLKNLFKKKKIKVIILNNQNKEEKFNPSNIYFTKIIISITKFLFKILSNLRYTSIDIKKWKNFHSKHLFISYLNSEDLIRINRGSFKSSYWGNLDKKLSKKGIKSRWIHFVAGKDKLVASSIKAIKKLNLRNDQQHISIYSFLNLKILIKSVLIWLRLILRINSIKYPRDIFSMQDSLLDFWPLFKRDWVKSFHGENMINNIVIDQIFCDLLKNTSNQNKCFYLSENVPWEFSLIKSWKSNNHKNIYAVPHSTISFWDLRHFFSRRSIKETKEYDQPKPNKIIANGQDMKEKLLASGIRKKDIIYGEALRYIDLIKNFELRKRHRKLIKPRILVTLDIADEVAKTQLYFIKKLINKNKGLNIKIKLHPAGNINAEDYKEIAEKFSSSPLLELLKKTDIMFSSNITAAAAEAYVLGIPILSYIEVNTLNLSPLKNKKNIKFLSNVNQFTKAINIIKKQRIKKNKNNNFFFLDKKLNKWNKILE